MHATGKYHDPDTGKDIPVWSYTCPFLDQGGVICHRKVLGPICLQMRPPGYVPGTCVYVSAGISECLEGDATPAQAANVPQPHLPHPESSRPSAVDPQE